MLTGATGFVGRHLARELYARGVQTIGIVRTGSDPSVIGVPIATVALSSTEMGNRDALADVLAGSSVVVHAATVYGRQSENFAEIEDANVQMPLALLKAARLARASMFLHLDSFFSKPDFVHQYLPRYTESKKSFLFAARSSDCADDVRVVNARLEHVYGPEDRDDKFLPWLVDSVLSGNPVRLTSGQECRDFIHVADVARALRAIITSRTSAPEFEIGTGNATAVRSVVELVHTVSASTSPLLFGALMDPENGIPSSSARLDAIHHLGWSPRISLLEGIRELVASRRSRHQRIASVPRPQSQ